MFFRLYRNIILIVFAMSFIKTERNKERSTVNVVRNCESAEKILFSILYVPNLTTYLLYAYPHVLAFPWTVRAS